MIYNSQPTQSGHKLPLLMDFSTPINIEVDNTSSPIIYDPLSQLSTLDMRIIGTYSLKIRGTIKPGNHSVSDKKNEIDDQKNVK